MKKLTPKQMVLKKWPTAECWQSYKDWPRYTHIIYFRLHPRHLVSRWPTARQAWADAARRIR